MEAELRSKLYSPVHCNEVRILFIHREKKIWNGSRMAVAVSFIPLLFNKYSSFDRAKMKLDDFIYFRKGKTKKKSRPLLFEFSVHLYFLGRKPVNNISLCCSLVVTPFCKLDSGLRRKLPSPLALLGPLE